MIDALEAQDKGDRLWGRVAPWWTTESRFSRMTSGPSDPALSARGRSDWTAL